MDDVAYSVRSEKIRRDLCSGKNDRLAEVSKGIG
jgi:hypothetical protein